MVVVKINGAIEALDWSSFMRTPPGRPEFVEREDEVLKSTSMEWANGDILIVEVPSQAHSELSRAFNNMFQQPFGCGDSFSESCRRFEPNESYRPMNAAPFGAQLPDGLADWREFITVKVKVGVFRTWGCAPGFLDWKANQQTKLPGVQYTLCIATDRDFTICEYKLYDVKGVKVQLPFMDPIPVVPLSMLDYVRPRQRFQRLAYTVDLYQVLVKPRI
ncbi:TPA: hypothetical protein N0F65_012721 [Lagenidium giganteum]|uniref:Restriction endonuclease domain-containing protein n=1 Tax=Lagenidium giganteum TaxID=4803 RepID=A0AAV2YE38_9STRA|nr:TPA: hypothetical protein N0F65_012721 [Lagenidium giganteum]